MIYNFECDWLIEMSDNKLSNDKLSDNNLASELVKNRRSFKPIRVKKIVTFMINTGSNVAFYSSIGSRSEFFQRR